jgi:hypothetical protein
LYKIAIKRQGKLWKSSSTIMGIMTQLRYFKVISNGTILVYYDKNAVKDV